MVADLPVDFSKWKQFLKVVILPTAEESATDKANVATKGAVYEGVGTVVVHGIEGGFTCGVPRFNLSDEELCLAEQSAGILRIVWRD